ncbi:MAG: aldo/keto reductase [Archangium sp.]
MSDSFSIGNALPVRRLGFGAMRITGDGIWGPPRDEAEALKVLKRALELGVNFIDTADSYGPYVSEELIARALHPYAVGLVIATKAGLTRPGPNQWVPNGRPDYLRNAVHASLRRLKQERLQLWQLHRIDGSVPRDEQFGAIAAMQKEGLIEHVGLSEVSVAEIKAAQQHFTVATVQNLYNLVNRKSEAVLDYCEKENIGFIPWYPLAAGALSRPGSILSALAEKYGVTTSALALAWVLQRSRVMLPIPGTGKVKHLEENMAAAKVTLSADDFAQLDAQGRAEHAKG